MIDDDNMSAAQKKMLEAQLAAAEHEFGEYPNWRNGMLFGGFCVVIGSIAGCSLLPLAKLHWGLGLVLGMICGLAAFFIAAFRPQ